MTKLNNLIAQCRNRKELKHPSENTSREKELFDLAVSSGNKFLKTIDIQDLEGAISQHEAALALRPKGHPDRHQSLHWLAWCLHQRYRKQGTLPDLDKAITSRRTALDLHPEGYPSRFDSLLSLAVCLSDRYDRLALVADLEEAITLGRAVLNLLPPRHFGRALTLSNLGLNLRRRFLELGATADLDEALSLHQSALDLRPADHPNRSDSLFSLAVCFSDRYNKQASTADLEEAITFGRAALKLRPPGHSDRVWTLNNLGLNLRSRFLELGATADLDDALSLHQSALDLRPADHPNRSDSLFSLAVCFSDRYNKQASTADLEEAITFGRAALKLRPPGHSDRVWTLNNLGLNLRSRFLELGATADLDEALSLHQSALDLRPEGHPNRSDSLHPLAVCFSDRYDKWASVADLEEAITLGRVTLKLRPPGHTCRAFTLNNLGLNLRHRFLKLGATPDLDEALSLHQLALDLRPEGHPNRSDSLHNLALCFRDRYNKQASVADLEEAITLGRAALNLRPPGHSDRALTLNHLVKCLGLRFEKLETPADLDDLIALSRDILDLHPPGHEGRAKSIDELLCHLRKRGQKLGVTADLEECIKLGRTAIGLHKPGSSGHATCRRHLVSDLQSMHRNLESAFANAHSSPDHIVSLHNLVQCVWDMVNEGHISRDVDEIVAVVRSLSILTSCFQQRGDIADPNEAIFLYKRVLELYPPDSSDRAPTLHKLASCLSTRTDLDDVIKFEQDASMLYPPDHPDRVQSFSSLASYYQLKLDQRGVSPRPDHLDATANLPIEQVVSDIISDVLKAVPLRLLDSHSGMLCDRSAQILHFKNSQQYKQLVSTSILGTLSQTSMHEVVSTYFQYVILSHRWGAVEPLLRDIKGQVIYNLDRNAGLSKLQSFCLATLKHGYIWAWSDTCCIDKESSAELQEAIGSMFSWYRQSVLTMVHLADVSDTCPLTSSEWFKRGWTLQELLAPRTLLFFTQNWSLYGDISLNHKKDTAILDKLQQVTGIMSEHLSSFHPGVDDARMRLQWASTRCTTRPEDIAYSLFGVFDFHLPVLYGESAENALGRLLAELISKSGDASILDWVGQRSAFHSCFPYNIRQYETPLQPLSLGRAASPNIQDNHQPVISVQEKRQELSKLPRTHFVKPRLLLPCIVHRVEYVHTRTPGTAATHVHRIQATGLEPVEVTLSQPLEDISKEHIPYVLIRLCHSNLLDESVTDDDAWFTMMQQPFSALLLKQLRQNEYTRVASSFHIVAHPTTSNGALEGEVITLTVI